MSWRFSVNIPLSIDGKDEVGEPVVVSTAMVLSCCCQHPSGTTDCVNRHCHLSESEHTILTTQIYSLPCQTTHTYTRLRPRLSLVALPVYAAVPGERVAPAPRWPGRPPGQAPFLRPQAL